jgi:hypothetical protein
MAKGRKTGGRRKGTPNKATASVRAAWLAAFDTLGGADGLATWARANPDRFYTLAARLLPPAVPDDRPMTRAEAKEMGRRIRAMTDEELEAAARELGLA